LKNLVLRIMLSTSLLLILAPDLGLATTRTKKFLTFHTPETMTQLLRRHGFNAKHLAFIFKQNLLPKGLSLSHGESYRLSCDASRSACEIKIYDARNNISYLFWRERELAGAKQIQDSLVVKQRTISGRINGSILSSIMNVLPSRWIAYRFIDAYAFDYNLPRTLQRGARFSARIETKWDGPDLVGYGEILETSLEIGDTQSRRYFVRYDKGGTFLDPKLSRHNRPLFAPVSYLHISSGFAPRRFHPIKQRRQPHLGIDFELPEGTDVFAANAGTVLRAGHQRGAGNFVVIVHPNGLETSYDHLSAIAPGLMPGVNVLNGQKIGDVGCTGYCTKAHLHFAVKSHGQYIDPISKLKNYPSHSVEMIGRQEEAFRDAQR
jgi:murein DD-endopeptidase MepM/ murein hydrolase activator NlpD